MAATDRPWGLRESYLFDKHVIAEIQRAAEQGIYDVRGSVAALGADCIEKELQDEHSAELRDLLDRAGLDDVDPSDFRRYGSGRALYNFRIDNAGAY